VTILLAVTLVIAYKANMTKSIQDRRRRARNKLRQLTFVPLMRGSLVERRRKCGHSYCACATDPERQHPGMFFTVKLDGRQQSLHVRPEDEPAIRAAVEAYDCLWNLVNELTACEIDQLRQAARNRKERKS